MRDASGRSKGCGIVEYRTPAEAQEAINTLLDTELKGRLIFVREDREAAGVCRSCFGLFDPLSSSRSSRLCSALTLAG